MNAPNYTHALARTLQQKADELGLSVADYLLKEAEYVESVAAMRESRVRYQRDQQARQDWLFETGQMDAKEESLYRKSREENSHE